MLGIGGGPDGFTLALGNDLEVAKFSQVDIRAFFYGAYAFGRKEDDGGTNFSTRTTASSGSLKMGGALRLLASKGMIISVLMGYSWTLQVPLVVEVGPNGTDTYREHSGYFTNAPIIGFAISAR